MADLITINELIKFQGKESTDPIVAVTQLPYTRPVVFYRGLTYNDGYEEYTRGKDPRGSQVIVRTLGAGNAEVVDVRAAGSLDFNHTQTEDQVYSIPIDTVIKRSEKVYALVDEARQSADGAAKAQQVYFDIIEAVQRNATTALVEGANELADKNETPLETLREYLIDTRVQEMDDTPTVLMVNKSMYGKVLKLQTSGDFIPVNDWNGIIVNGLVGRLLGMNVIYNPYLPDDVEFIMYNHEHFLVFPFSEYFGFVDARPDFLGSYVQGMLLTKAAGRKGPNGEKPVLGEGVWGVVKKVETGA